MSKRKKLSADMTARLEQAKNGIEIRPSLGSVLVSFTVKVECPRCNGIMRTCTTMDLMMAQNKGLIDSLNMTCECGKVWAVSTCVNMTMGAIVTGPGKGTGT